MNQKTNKIVFMSYMKAFGIIYLLLGHSASPFAGNFVNLFFLQMFFFISGYFYKDEYTLTPGLFFIKRVKSLYIPFVLYCSAFLACNNLFLKLNIYDESMRMTYSHMLRDLFYILILYPSQPMATAMWFISVLFMTNILFCTVSCFVNYLVRQNHEYVRALSIFMIYMIGYYLSIEGVRLLSFADISLVAVLFYYLGYLYHKHETRIPNKLLIALLSLLVLSISTQYGFIEMFRRKYVNPFFLLACGLSGIYFNLYISKALAGKQSIKIINYIGNNTFTILALHFIAFKIASLILIYYKNLSINVLSDFPMINGVDKYWWWFYFLAGLILPLTYKYTCEMVLKKLAKLRI